MNLKFAAAPGSASDLRILTDNELDAVNGGFFFVLFLIGAGIYLVNSQSCETTRVGP